jgi:hypothetical protein
VKVRVDQLKVVWRSSLLCPQDGIGDFFFDPDTKLYWVSFLDGMQRVLMFTEDIVLATTAQQVGSLFCFKMSQFKVLLCYQRLVNWSALNRRFCSHFKALASP